MKPAICAICGNRSPLIEGDWVEFSDYTTESSSQITHPEGLEWFCKEHLEAAKSISNLTASEGIRKLLQEHQLQTTSGTSGYHDAENGQKKSLINKFANMFRIKNKNGKIYK